MTRRSSGIRLILAAVALLGASKAHAAAVDIDRVEVTGVTVFPTPEIEGSLEIGPGERLEKVKVVRSAENLQALYRIHGYEQATIKSKLSRVREGGKGPVETVLEFEVVEGKPTRIAEIRFVAESIREESFQRYWRGLEQDLAAKIGLVSGDIFDQERIGAGKRAVQDLLASEEFVGARVDDVRVTNASEPGRSGAPDGSRWVKLEFRVALGDRVSFGFRGNNVFTAGRLLSMVEEQRLLGFGKDYVGAIQTRIEDEYRALGYPNVEVTPLTLELPATQEKHVTFLIKEGARMAIGAVSFDGNTVFSSPQLTEQFFKRASTLVSHRYYSEKDIQHGAELVVEWIRSQGYLSAKLVSINTAPVTSPRARTYGAAVNVTIYLYEGDQTVVDSINVEGVQAFPEDEILRTLGVQEGKPLNLFAFSEGIEALKARYRSMGYLNMQVSNEASDQVVRYSDENRLAAIHLDVSEGPRFKVGQIQIEGLQQTAEDVVRRELLFREGDVLEEPQITASEAALRRLGIFSLANIRLNDDPGRPDMKNIQVSLQEGTPGVVAGGMGFRNDLGVRLFAQTAYTNVGGRNHTVSLNVAANHRFTEFRFAEYDAQLSYIWPHFLFGDTTFRPAITADATQFSLFDANTVSASLTWEKPILRSPNLVGLFTYTLERINQFHAISAIDDQALTIGAISPALRMDLRDNPLAPTRGFYGAVSLEVASPYFGSQLNPFPVGYARFQGRADYHVPLSQEASWYFSFRYGFERNTQDLLQLSDGSFDPRSGAIPLSKQFALGGAGSIRGYKEQELNYFNLTLRGTMSYVNYRTQIDLPLAGALRFGPFLDAGNLQFDTYSFGNLRWGSGVGFRYVTPVGPINLDWGFKLFPRPGEDPYRIYFSVGVI